MISAADPPELPPIVARPSGSLVSLTLALLLDERQHFGLDELRVASRHRVVLEAALAALGVAAAVADRDRDHRRHALLRDQVVERCEQQRSGPSAPTMNGAAVPGTYCFGT